MIKVIIILALLSSFGFSHEEGDLSVNVGGVSNFAFTERSPSFGGLLGVQYAFNDQTNFLINGEYIQSRIENIDEKLDQKRFTFTSLFTPYFGDIYPKFGGTFGIMHETFKSSVDEVYVMVGADFVTAAQFGETMEGFFKVSPTLTFGETKSKKDNFNISITVGFNFTVIQN